MNHLIKEKHSIMRFVNHDFLQKKSLELAFQLVHQGKIFKGGICPSSFTLNSNSTGHIESIHKERCKCEISSSDFKTNSNFTKHIESVHGGGMFKCNICP